jgi:hypothetical protein
MVIVDVLPQRWPIRSQPPGHFLPLGDRGESGFQLSQRLFVVDRRPYFDVDELLRFAP